MLRKARVLLLGLLVSACATTQQTPIVITATPPAESPTPRIIVVTSTEDPFKPTATFEPTPMPTATPRPKWQPIAIADVEAAFREDGYRRHPMTAESGKRGFSWVKESSYERAFTWEDGLIMLEVLHDKSPSVRSEHMERKFRVLDTVLPSGFMAQLRDEHAAYNNSVGEKVSGDPEKINAYGGEWTTIWAEYNARETNIGGYRVRFSLWWWQSTCPPQYSYCYYEDFPGLEFTGDSSFVFQTIKLIPIEGGELFEVEEQTASAVEEPTPDHVGKSWEFNSSSTEGWEAWWHLRSFSVGQGTLTAESIGDDPYMGSSYIRMSADEYPYIEIRMKLTRTGPEDWGHKIAEVFFITNREMEFDGNKRIDFTVIPDSEFHTYLIDMSVATKWVGEIRQIRIDPLAARGKIEIDYVRLLSKDLFMDEDEGGRASASTDTIPGNVGRSWEFFDSIDFRGWEAYDILNPIVYGGNLNFRCVGEWPLMVSPEFIVEAEGSPLVEIRMKISNVFKPEGRKYLTGKTAVLYFYTDKDQQHDDVKKMVIDVIGDGDFHIYTLDMSTLASWKGQITTLLFHPFDVHGDVELDYIRFLGDDASEGGGIQDMK